MAEHHKLIHMPFSSHAAKPQQCPEGFACSWSSKHKNVAKISAAGAA